MEAWKAVLPKAWLSNKQLAPAPGPDSSSGHLKEVRTLQVVH